MALPTPQECGLPAKFDSWRPNQESMLNVILTSRKRITTLCAPTGSGKSPIAVAAALLSKVPTCIVTESRGLQDQYTREYEEIGMVDLRGRANYPCTLRDDHTCEDGFASRCPYRGTVSCPASQAEMRAAVSSLVVTNYAKWTATKMFGTGMSHFKQVIFDEAHSAPDALARAMQVTLHHREVEETLRLQFPALSSDVSDVGQMQIFKHWA